MQVINHLKISPWHLSGSSDCVPAHLQAYMEELQGVIDKLVEECCGQMGTLKQAVCALALPLLVPSRCGCATCDELAACNDVDVD